MQMLHPIKAACSRYGISGMEITALIQYFGETTRVLSNPQNPRRRFRVECIYMVAFALEKMARHHQEFLNGYLSPNIDADGYRILRVLAEEFDYQIPTPKTLRTTAARCLNPDLFTQRKIKNATKILQTIYDLLKQLHAELNPICSS